MSAEIQHKILGLLYEQWYKNYITGSSIQELIQLSDYSQNELNQSLSQNARYTQNLFCECCGMRLRASPRICKEKA